MTSADPRALVISHEPNGGAGEIERYLARRGYRATNHQITDDLEKPNESRPFPTFTDYDVLVVMGSVHNLTARQNIDNWVETEIDLLRAAHEAGQPILGVCFGGQLLAEALGGSVEPAPVIEVGWYTIDAPPGATNPVGPGPWLEWHHDRFQAPPDAEVLAETPDATQLFRIGSTVGTQFHPEVTVEHIETWLGMADDAYLESLGLTRSEILADAELHESDNIAQCHNLVDWFLDEVAATG